MNKGRNFFSKSDGVRLFFGPPPFRLELDTPPPKKKSRIIRLFQ